MWLSVVIIDDVTAVRSSRRSYDVCRVILSAHIQTKLITQASHKDSQHKAKAAQRFLKAKT